jgi:hypothetical protein
MQGLEVPNSVLSAWNLEGSTVSPLGSGLINQTWLVSSGAGRYVLQQLNPVFPPGINEDIQVVAAQIEGADAGALRNAVDGLKDRLKKAVIVLATTDASGKITVVAGVTAAESAKLKAGEIVAAVAAQIGGKGGGRPDFAQGGGTEPAGIPAAMAAVEAFILERAGR